MEKLFYSIKEVAAELNVNPSLLRFWEKEFPQLKPRKNAKGTRFYTTDDIKLLKEIHYLVKDQHLTLEGARQRLKISKDEIARKQEIVERLRHIRQELLNMRKAFVALSKENN
ncbi:MAG: MerR family transcriptional regulator [Microbacter sp.]